MANYDLTYEGSRVQNILDTGDELRDAGYIFRGEATPSTVPGTPTERVAYIGGPGTYTNFGSSTVVPSGSIGVFKYTGSAWSNEVIACTVPISTSVQNNDTTVPTGKAVKTAVDAEASARQLGDSTLQGGINTVSAAITAINNAIANGSVYAGIATPSSTPASGKVFYLAFTAGTYTNFNSLEVPQGINILKNNGSTWLLDSFLGIDDAPTQGSANLVKSGGVLNSIIQNGPAFDISAYNAQGGTLATYADLSAALTALNALPAAYKKGGMSFKFVLSSDNKYVQYFLTKDEWSASEADWQKINLEEEVSQLGQEMQKKIDPGYYFEFRKRFIAAGYYSPVNGYSCTSIFEGDGSEYVFPSTTNVQCSYKIFQYVSDSEGIEITDGWQNAELRFNITGKFIVTFYGTFTEQDKSVYEWLIANWRLGGYDVALEPRVKLLENSAVINMEVQGASLIGKTKNKEIYIPFPEFYTKNLLNLDDSDVMLGYRQYSDTPQQNSLYNLSGYIPVTPGVTYCYSTSNTQYAVIQYYAVFNKNRNFIRGGVDAITTFTAQPGDAFVRITLRAAAWRDDNQFEIGTIPTEYKPFGVNFKYPSSEIPEIVMPKIVYTTKGVENSVYHKNYCNFLTDNFIIASYRNYRAAAWKYLSRCFRTTNGNQTIEMRLYQKSPFKYLKGLSIQSVVGDPATDNGNVKVICIGDSFTYDGRYLQQIADICPNINLVGMREPAQNIQSDSIRCEGRGGWKLYDYMQPYSDLTPSHMQPFSPFVQADGYNYYGPTPFWAAIVNGTSQYSYGTNGFEDYKSWFGADGYKLNPSVNDLMYDGTSFKYWDGTSWTALSTAPTFTFDFAKYISIWQIPAPNMVFVFLGKNDFNSGVADWGTFKANLDSLIASIHSYNSNIIIGVCTPTTADEAKNNSDNANSFLGHMNMWNARKLMVENYDNLSTSRVFIVDTGTTLDPDYGFVLEEKLPFAFYEGDERELFAANGVHPSGAGYKQLGTCIAGFIQAKR